MKFLNKLLAKTEKPGMDKSAARSREASANSNYEKAVRLTLEKSAPCRQRRYGMKNYDMT